MKFSITHFFIVLLLVVIGGSLLLFSLDGDTKVNWHQNYNPTSKSPYGLYIFNNEINHFFEKPVTKYGKTGSQFLVENDSSKTYNFIYISQHFFLSKVDKRIISSVEKGSNLLVSDNNFLIEIDDKIIEKIEITNSREKTFSLTNTPKKLKIKSEIYESCSAISDIDKKLNANILGYIQIDNKKYVNFIEISHGKGKIFIHSAPYVFTNYYLKDLKSDVYISQILGHLPLENKTIWFDEYFNSISRNRDILDVIFQYPSLTALWRLFFGGLILFVIFRGKRTQRIIPVIEKLKNTTIEFTQTIGNLYFQEKNSTEMMQKKITYFLDNIRRKFYLDTQKIDANFTELLIKKSGVSPEIIQQILLIIQQFETNKNINEKKLIELDTLIDKFWKNTNK